MTDLDDVLKLNPGSNAHQIEILQKEYRISRIEDLQGAVVFGAAILGTQVANTLENSGIRVFGFADNDPTRWNGTHEGRMVYSPEELDKNRPIVIASKYVKDIYAGLSVQGKRHLIPHYLLACLFPDSFNTRFHCLSADTITADRIAIQDTFHLLSDQQSKELFCRLLRFRITLNPMDLPEPTPGQYFPGDFWPLSSQEVFVDIGACNGDTLIDFLGHTKGVFSRYFALEPDPQNFIALNRSIPAGFNDKVVALQCAAGSRRQQTSFVSDAGGESRIAVDGSINIETIPIDELFESEAVSTIKIDVEGYETEVLEGARSTIAIKRPKLAVSVYHRLQDIWKIPMWIKACDEGYSFYLRHHTPEIYDTVLYCVPDPPRTMSQKYFPNVSYDPVQGDTFDNTLLQVKADRS
jgi:FkbM family methyltransferase